MPPNKNSSGNAAKDGRKKRRDGWTPPANPKSEVNVVKQMVKRISHSNGVKAATKSLVARPTIEPRHYNDTTPNVMAGITMPCAANVFRAPPIFGSHATALAAPWARFGIAGKAWDGAGSYAMNGQGFVAISRSVYQNIIWSTVTVPKHDYKAVFNVAHLNQLNTENTYYQIYPQLTANSESFYMNLEPWSWDFDGSVEGSIAAQGIGYASVDSLGHKWYFNGADMYAAFVVTLLSSTGTPFDGTASECSMLTYRLDADGSESIVSRDDYNTDYAHFKVIVNDPGYFRFAVQVGRWSDPKETYVYLRFECGGSTDQQYSFINVSEIQGASDQYLTSLRYNAQSLLLTNAGRELDKNGMIACCQLDNDESILPYILTDTPYDLLASRANSTILSQNTGAYGYSRPASADVWKFNPVFKRDQTNNGHIIGKYNPLNPPGGWLIMAYARDVTASYEFNITVSNSIEFTTRSTWYQLGMDRPTIAAFNAAIDKLYAAPQFTENPLHLKDLTNAIANVTKGAIRHGPAILSLFAKMFPQLRIPATAFQVAKLASKW